MSRLFPVDILQLAFHGLLLVLLVWSWPRFEAPWIWLGIDLASLSVLAIIVKTTRATSLRHAGFLRVVHGTITVPFLFSQIGYSLRALDAHDFAADLERIDRWIFFGHNPLEAVEGVATPWLTELLQLSYALYVALPASIALLLVWKAPTPVMFRSFFSLMGIIYASYVGYLIVPASGPNIHNNFGEAPCHVDPQPLYTFQTDLPGLWAAGWLREWMFSAELTKWDCFPSGHTAVAVAAMVYARRVGRGWLLGFAPVCLGIIASTVYLRYHYVVDVIAGAALAVIGLAGLEAWHRRGEPARFGLSATP